MDPEKKVLDLELETKQLKDFIDSQVVDQAGVRGALQLKPDATIDYLQLRLAVDQFNAMNAYLAALRSRIAYEKTLASLKELNKPKSSIILP